MQSINMQSILPISSEDIPALVQQTVTPFFVVIHQPTVTISVNQIIYINNNIEYLKYPIYFIEFEIVRTQLLESLRAANTNFAYFGFPCMMLFYEKQIIFMESGAVSISSLNELAELAIAHFTRQSRFI
jgi:hypothetical protein